MLCLSGKGSVISCDIFPPIPLPGQWEIGLVDFTTYNSIPNIEENVNNKFHFGKEVITMPTGSYEIEDINNFIQSRIKSPQKLELKPNNNTLKTEIFSSEEVDFTQEASIAPLLGFSKTKLDANKWHESDKPVDIIKVNVIRIECNVVSGAYTNGTESHIIHEFYPSVAPGFKIIETPRNVIYLPVNVERLSRITIYLTDQDNRLINLRGETVNIRLHLRDGSRFQ